MRLARTGDGSRDLHGDFVGILVFPEPNNDPSRSPQCQIRLEVSLNIAIDLRIPIGRVGPRTRVVLGAAMPVATVNEDGNFQPCEQNVCGPAKCSYWPSVYAVSETQGVHAAAHLHFRLCSGASVRLHALSGLIA